MKRILILSLFLLCSLDIAAQTPTATPGPTPSRETRAASPLDRGLVNPRVQRDNMVVRQMILQANVQPLYRKPTKQELKAVAPDAELRKKFEAFLRQEDTGLFKFVADYGCAENPKIVTATENCLKFTMPGAGNSFSFRTHNYRIRRLADLTYNGKFLYISGLLTHGILVSIGDVPLENVTLQTAGTKYLNEFQPTEDFEKAVELDEQLIKGVEKEGFFYSRAAYAVENTTYLLRSIAYDGKIFRAVRGVTYNELDFDKRKDVTVAFRIVRRDDDGSVTVLWKELLRKDAPRIRRKPVETDKRIKENKFIAKNK
jgi:hypothetical protein